MTDSRSTVTANGCANTRSREMEVTTPVLLVRLKLPKRYYVRVSVWESRKDMFANVPEETERDYAAIFVESSAGRCIGTVHLSVEDIGKGTRAHEIRHAVDYYLYRAFTEHAAEVTESVTNDLEAALIALR